MGDWRPVVPELSGEELGDIWRANRHAANIALLEGDVVANALLDYLEQRSEGWEG